MKSLEQRLFEAFNTGRGMRLSRADVFDLVKDDAIDTRISNKACTEAGVDECGMNDVFISGATTWREFVNRQQREVNGLATKEA